MLPTNENRHEQRRTIMLRRRRLTGEEIAEQELGDPLFDAKATRRYCGEVSEMTLWRWGKELNFPPPDFVFYAKDFGD